MKYIKSSCRHCYQCNKISWNLQVGKDMGLTSYCD